jgi:hypothetical protein
MAMMWVAALRSVRLEMVTWLAVMLSGGLVGMPEASRMAIPIAGPLSVRLLAPRFGSGVVRL